MILGGGTAGVGTAAQLKNAGVEDICIVEPSDVHFYQVWDSSDGNDLCYISSILIGLSHDTFDLSLSSPSGIKTNSPGGLSWGRAFLILGPRSAPLPALFLMGYVVDLALCLLYSDFLRESPYIHLVLSLHPLSVPLYLYLRNNRSTPICPRVPPDSAGSLDPGPSRCRHARG